MSHGLASCAYVQYVIQEARESSKPGRFFCPWTYGDYIPS